MVLHKISTMNQFHWNFVTLENQYNSLVIDTLCMVVSKSVMHFARVPSTHQSHQSLFQTESKPTNQSRHNIFGNRL